MAENEISCEKEISVEAWGWGNESQKWTYKPEDGIFTQIIVAYGDQCIKLRFVDGSMEDSPHFGAAASANDTYNTQIININHPEEYLIGLSADLPSDVCIRVRPLRFHTNVDDIFKDCVPRYPGPWGGRGGRHWDDGVFSAVKQIHVHVSDFVCIHGIQFEYLGRDGRSTWSPWQGAKFYKLEKIKIECEEEEVLIGVAGYYGRVKGSGGMQVIKSLTFYTNKRLFGPYGDENGNHFTSMACRNGKVVGFRGEVVGRI
ncbi:UNVERIFIED_CONTAM: Agglutinin [Sesamum latifolium]|uniref:Agglutinin n=1 Tax=Sesamum latifolium TaxID=2727402 RepID=A0AAW2WE33_9LAMI